MSRIGRATYPEIECWSAVHPRAPTSAKKESQESVGVIAQTKIIGDESQPQVFHSERSFLDDFAPSSSSYKENRNAREVPLRIFFIDSEPIASSAPRGSFDNTQKMDSWFTATCGVSPLFLRLFCPSDEPYRNDGGASFSRKDAWGNIISLDGFYQIASGITLKPSYLWYKHSTTKNQDIASTYIIYQCPQSAKDQIISILQETPACLLRPLSVDALILAEQLNHWGTSMYHDHSKLRPIMSKVREHEEFPEDTVYNLHFLSEHFHAVRAVLEDLKERTEHLLDVYRKYPTLMRPSARLVGEFGDVEDSLAYLLAQTRTLMRWVGTYIEHTQIAVGLLFNLDTASIAKSTQQDSSSMITMAAVTMFFLPGTFVSALFSMVFFNADPSNTGLLVNSQLWLFFVITVPLTVAVFLTWELWRRWRVDSQRKSSPSNKRTASPDADDINPDEGGEALAYGLEEGGAFRASPSPTSSLRGGTKLRTHRHSTLSR